MADLVGVTVVYAPASDAADVSAVQVASGATVAQAITASGLLARHPALDLTRIKAGRWGKLVRLDAPLIAGERIEVYRPLRVDPKVARVARARRAVKKKASGQG